MTLERLILTGFTLPTPGDASLPAFWPMELMADATPSPSSKLSLQDVVIVTTAAQVQAYYDAVKNSMVGTVVSPPQQPSSSELVSDMI